MGNDKQLRFDSLQAARGVAAVLVAFFHATLLCTFKFDHEFLRGWFWFGYSGVDFFFVLSGFIITHVHAADLGAGTQALRDYLAKRLARIYPIYWVVLAPVVAAYLLWPHLGTDHQRNPVVVLKSVLLLPQRGFPVLSVAWTLNHEVFFYALFALAILAGRRWAAVGLAIWLSLTTVFWVLEMSGHHRTATVLHPYNAAPIDYPYGFLLSSYHIEFALGCLAALIVARRAVPLRNLLWPVGVALFLVAAATDAWGLRTFGNAHRILWFGLPSFLIVLGITAQEQVRPFRVPWLAKFVGDASYSLYLIHYVCLALLVKLALWLQLPAHLGSFITTCLLLVITVTAGCLCYALIEKPLLMFCRNRLRSFATGKARSPVRVRAA